MPNHVDNSDNHEVFQMSCLPKTAAARNYNRRFFTAMLLYVIPLCFDVWYIKHYHPAGPLVYFLALLPAIPLLAVIVVVGLYLAEEKDEFQRTVMIESMLCGIGLTLATTTTWGFLENFANVTPFQPYLAFPLFWFFVGVSTPLVKMRYR